MKKAFFIITFFCCLLFFSCKKYDENGNEIKFLEVYKAHWLLGDWQKTDTLGVLKETWTTLDDSTYTGKSFYIINKKDTVHVESMELMQDGEFLIYSATVKGENNNQSVSFQLTKNTDSLLVFENSKHDYPQKIEYKLIDSVSIDAIVSGKQMGKFSKSNYPLNKVK